MRGRSLFMGLALLTTTALGACGTVVDGGSQTVDVVVKGSPSAYCTFTTSKFRNSATFPNKLTIERSKENLHADCQGEQNRKVVFDVPPRMTANGSLGNIVYGVLPGMAYDSATGGMWEYPNPLVVDFREIGSGASVDWPDNKADADLNADTKGNAPIPAPQPLHMQPVMDEDLNPAAPVIKAPAPVSLAPLKANSAPEVIDPVSIAVKNKASATAVGGKMKPVSSPEDDPAVMKAKAEAEAKKKAAAAAEAKRKAAEKEAAKKKAAEEAKKAAADAEAAKAQAATTAPTPMLPETTTPAPGEAATTTTTTTVVTPAPAPAATPAAPAPATTQSTTTTTTTTAPAEPAKDDMDKYLQGQ